MDGWTVKSQQPRPAKPSAQELESRGESLDVRAIKAGQRSEASHIPGEEWQGSLGRFLLTLNNFCRLKRMKTSQGFYTGTSSGKMNRPDFCQPGDVASFANMSRAEQRTARLPPALCWPVISPIGYIRVRAARSRAAWNRCLLTWLRGHSSKAWGGQTQAFPEPLPAQRRGRKRHSYYKPLPVMKAATGSIPAWCIWVWPTMEQGVLHTSWLSWESQREWSRFQPFLQRCRAVAKWHRVGRAALAPSLATESSFHLFGVRIKACRKGEAGGHRKVSEYSAEGRASRGEGHCPGKP